MTDILITSSVLILALLILRRIFGKTLSRRVQYALWGLVLARLLIPASIFSLPPTDFSVITVTSPVRNAVRWQANHRVFYSDPLREMTPEALLEHNIQVSEVPTAEEGGAMILAPRPEPENRVWPPPEQGYLVRDEETNTVTLYGHAAVGPWEILGVIWRAGMVVRGVWFVLANARFYWKLRKNRTVYETDCRRRVYLVPEGVLPSPCLFGRSVYLTPAAVETPEKLRHVLAHEETHARHLDDVWSLLRCVCLTVYWFDPLVWVAAACAKTDCELACDEGALALLGEEERIPYGQTLLSLIPVRKGPSDPMISATTMTSGKRQLRDRITRIAQKPRQLAAAALTVALLVTLVSACTFTGGFTGEGSVTDPTPTPGPSENTFRTLTGQELAWFNRQFFNSPDPEEDFSYNLRNQFANPINLYGSPGDIDLYSLFYCDGSTVGDEERRTILNIGPDNDLPCPSYKLTAAEMDGLLKAHTGLAVADTTQKGLDSFTYDGATDAYYWSHGDTNYCGGLNFLCGTRSGGEVKLYHKSSSAGLGWVGWYCVTLSDQGEGEYWFVSNQACEHPAIPPALPGVEPVAVVPLGELTPYPDAQDLLDENGDLTVPMESYGYNYLVDLDGDGHDEQVSGTYLYLQRDGEVYQVRLDDLLEEACPELGDWGWENWDIYGRRAYVTGLTDWDKDKGMAMWERQLYFDGENILVYKISKTTVDHMVDGIDVGVPDQVIQEAKAQVEKYLVEQPDGTWRHVGLGPEEALNYPMDDWRIESFHGPYTYTFGDATLVGWGYNYEKHTTQPERVGWAGGMYVTEDGWVSPGYPGCDYLFFQREDDGGLTFLWPGFYQESMNSIYVKSSLLQSMEATGVDVSPTTYAALEAGLRIESLSYGDEITLHGNAGGRTVPLGYWDKEVLESLTDPELVTWSRVEPPAQEPDGDSVTLRTQDWHDMLQFWGDSGLVMYKNTNDPEGMWYLAESQGEDAPYRRLLTLYEQGG